jgi:chromosome partitioning protein
MRTLLVANAKGGSGKTTLATNVAGWLAGKRQRVVLADHDPQRTATEWLERRPPLFPPIIGLAPDGRKRDVKGFDPQWMVIDSPAGLAGHDLDDALRGADGVLVPISPSAFDIAATRRFLAAWPDPRRSGAAGCRSDWWRCEWIRARSRRASSTNF